MDVLTTEFYASTISSNLTVLDDYPGGKKIIMAMVIMVPLGVLICVLNGLIITTILASRDTRDSYYSLLCSLAFADLLSGLLAIPCTASFTYRRSYQSTIGDVDCSLKVFGISSIRLNYSSSILSIVLLTVDRYIIIRHSYWYYANVTKAKTIIAILLVWLSSLMVAVWPIVDHLLEDSSTSACTFTYLHQFDYVMTWFICLFIAPLICLISLYSVLVKVAIKHSRAIAALPRPADINTTSIQISEQSGAQQLSEDCRKEMTRTLEVSEVNMSPKGPKDDFVKTPVFVNIAHGQQLSESCAAMETSMSSAVTDPPLENTARTNTDHEEGFSQADGPRSSDHNNREHTERMTKMVKTLLLILGTFLISWLPYNIFVLRASMEAEK